MSTAARTTTTTTATATATAATAIATATATAAENFVYVTNAVKKSCWSLKFSLADVKHVNGGN